MATSIRRFGRCHPQTSIPRRQDRHLAYQPQKPARFSSPRKFSHRQAPTRSAPRSGCPTARDNMESCCRIEALVPDLSHMPASVQPIYAGTGFRGGIGFFETCYLLVVYDGLLFARKVVAHLCSFLSVVFSFINIPLLHICYLYFTI